MLHHVGAGQRQGLDLVLGAVLRDAESSAQLPVDLHDDGDLVRDGQLLVEAREGLLGDEPLDAQPLAELLGKADMYIYAACAGIWGSASLLLMSVVSRTFLHVFETGDTDGLKHWETYLFVGLMIGTVMVQTRYLNKALLRREEALARERGGGGPEPPR